MVLIDISKIEIGIVNIIEFEFNYVFIDVIINRIVYLFDIRNKIGKIEFEIWIVIVIVEGGGCQPLTFQ